MCCFSRSVKHVSATQIFARLLPEGRQSLVYSMNVEINDELAMVLPIPVALGSAEDAVTFVNLAAYPKLFSDMQKAFPDIRSASKGSGLAPARLLSRQTLEVHDVGAFVASFVPSPDDFERLDSRFRLMPQVFEAHPEYADYGFAVFQLKPQKGWFGRSKRQTVHPMAFTFPSRKPNALFYPTLHVHDGDVPERASFDHSLYCQVDPGVLAETLPFARSPLPIGRHVDVERAAGLIDGESICYRNVVLWEQRNDDHWYEPPACAGAHVLRGEGELFKFKLSATAAYYTALDSARSRAFHEAVTTKLDVLHAGLLAGLRTLTAERRESWGLLSIGGEMEQAWLSNDHVYGAADYGPQRLEVGSERAMRLQISTCTEDVIESQQVELGFRRVPAPARVAEIREALNVIVRRAIC